MKQYYINELTYNKVLTVMEERANYFADRVKEMEDFPKWASLYRERFNEMVNLLEELWELDEVE